MRFLYRSSPRTIFKPREPNLPSMPVSQAKVKSVLSGDTLVLTSVNNPNQERILSLAFVSAPRMRREGEEVSGERFPFPGGHCTTCGIASEGEDGIESIERDIEADIVDLLAFRVRISRLPAPAAGWQGHSISRPI